MQVCAELINMRERSPFLLNIVQLAVNNILADLLNILNIVPKTLSLQI